MEARRSDDELLAAFEAGAIRGDEFPHALHVRVAWLLARRYGRAEGLDRLAAGIASMAARAGRPSAYHATITRAWFELIASVDDLERHAELFDTALLGRYYSATRLAAGRDHWLEPDLHPLTLPPPPRRDDLITALACIPTAVGVLAVRAERAVHAATVSTIASVSREPALIGVSLANGSRTLELIGRAHAFTLSVLASGQHEFALRFADRRRSAGSAQFDGIAHHMTHYGPALDDAVLTVGCDVHARHACGDHELVIGVVRVADARPDLEPLVQYHARR